MESTYLNRTTCSGPLDSIWCCNGAKQEASEIAVKTTLDRAGCNNMIVEKDGALVYGVHARPAVNVMREFGRLGCRLVERLRAAMLQEVRSSVSC